LDVNAKIKAHQRAGFPVSNKRVLDPKQWAALKEWVAANDDARFRRNDQHNGKVFYTYSRGSAGGMYFAPAKALEGYKFNKKRANAPLKRYKKAMGVSQDSRFKSWCKANLNSSAVRGLKNELNEDELREFFDKPCFFCGASPEENKSWGIDRLQNKVGYTYDNCVPCCKKCNFAKGTNDLHDFLDRVSLIAKKFS
jgi:hypothetical protein